MRVDNITSFGSMLGKVKIFALSITGAFTKSELQDKGWAICDGTTPATQGISNPIITTTPDLQQKFIRMSNDESSGSEGGRDNTISETDRRELSVGGDLWYTKTLNINGDDFLRPGNSQFYSATFDNKPLYYEVAYFIKVK